MEWNAESVLDALNDFERKAEISPILDEYLERIAKNGEIVFPWCKLKPLLKKKLEVVLDEFYETCPVETSVPVPNFETFNFDALKTSILQAVDSFTSAPFTIQRLCELVINPTKHYNRTDKYMRGIEKNVLVVSTIEPRSAQGDGNNANNPVVNGIVNDSPRDDNDTLNGHESTDSVSSSNLNTPSNHVLLENFANVFPSAACIPSASNICINRDIDSNFLTSTDCVETQEVEFDAAPPVEPLEAAAPKEEEMDTAEDEQPNIEVDGGHDADSEVGSGDAMPTEDGDTTDEKKTSDDEPSDSLSELDTLSSDSGDSVGASENAKIEADCSESLVDPPISDPEIVGKNECQQDDTISQSDDASSSSPEASLSVDKSEETAETHPAEDAPSMDTPSEEQEIIATHSTEQSMELETPSSSEEPPV